MLRLIGFLVLAVILAQVLAALPVIGPIFARTGIFGVWIAAILLSFLATRYGEHALHARRDAAELARLDAVDSPHNHGKAGTLLLNGGRASKAVPHLEAAAAGEPDVAEWHYRLGLACLRIGRHAEARDALERCVAIDEEHGYGQALLQLAAARRALGEGDAALEAIERAERNHGPSPESAYRRGRALSSMGRRAEARKSFAEVSRLASSAPRFQRREANAWAARAFLGRIL